MRTFISFLWIYMSLIGLRQMSAQQALTLALQAKLDTLIATHDMPGATLAVYFGQDRQISIAGGFADKEVQQVMPKGGQMLLGSTGKTFVAAVLLQLVEEEKIELDERLLHYFPEEEWMRQLPEADKLSIRMLLTHTSGMPRYIFQQEFLSYITQHPLATFSPKDRLSYVLNKAPVHPAGEGWSYSDTNYLLLGMLIEKMSGQPFYDLLQTQILEPHHLSHTYPSTQPKLPGLVQGYIGSNNFFGLPQKVVSDGKYAMNPQFEWTGGGLVSNVEDLSKWIFLLHSGQILDRHLHQEMLRVVDVKTGQAAETGYGFANFTWKNGEQISYGHSGMMPGFVTQIEYFPDQNYSMALQINTDQGRKTSLHQMMIELEAVVREYH
ncbi:MAG: serine hydrolase domain-containing protein [Bacteroidota bacterium]